MQDTVFLYMNPQGVDRMTKRQGKTQRGEIMVRLDVTVKSEAFREPTLIRQIEITDWREGLDMGDIEFRQPFISEAEAARIRHDRIRHQAETLAALGYTVIPPEVGDEQGPG